MRTKKGRRWQHFFKTRQGLCCEVPLAIFQKYKTVIPLRFEARDFGCVDKEQAVAGVQGDPIKTTGGSIVAQLLQLVLVFYGFSRNARFAYGSDKLFRVNGFEQIIQGAVPKGSKGKFVVRGGENDLEVGVVTK